VSDYAEHVMSQSTSHKTEKAFIAGVLEDDVMIAEMSNVCSHGLDASLLQGFSAHHNISFEAALWLAFACSPQARMLRHIVSIIMTSFSFLLLNILV
jgi:hypothetical protein